MGMLEDMGRIIGNGVNTPRPGFAESIKNAADASDAARAYQANGGAPGMGPANPFDAMAAYNAAVPGSGTVKSIVDTGQKFETTTIYDITLDVTTDGQPPYEVVHRQMIAAAALGNWQPGKVITLRVDPKDKTQVMLG